jgi:hypothetical protein
MNEIAMLTIIIFILVFSFSMLIREIVCECENNTTTTCYGYFPIWNQVNCTQHCEAFR